MDNELLEIAKKYVKSDKILINTDFILDLVNEYCIKYDIGSDVTDNILKDFKEALEIYNTYSYQTSSIYEAIKLTIRDINENRN